MPLECCFLSVTYVLSSWCVFLHSEINRAPGFNQWDVRESGSQPPTSVASPRWGLGGGAVSQFGSLGKFAFLWTRYEWAACSRLQPWGLFVVFVDCPLEPCVTLEGGSCGIWACSTWHAIRQLQVPVGQWRTLREPHLTWNRKKHSGTFFGQKMLQEECFLPNEDFLAFGCLLLC